MTITHTPKTTGQPTGKRWRSRRFLGTLLCVLTLGAASILVINPIAVQVGQTSITARVCAKDPQALTLHTTAGDYTLPSGVTLHIDPRYATDGVNVERMAYLTPGEAMDRLQIGTSYRFVVRSNVWPWQPKTYLVAIHRASASAQDCS